MLTSCCHSLIPNVSQLEDKLSIFCKACGADEVVIFERATFLVIAHSTRKAYADVHRFEKVCNKSREAARDRHECVRVCVCRGVGVFVYVGGRGWSMSRLQ